MMTGDFGGARRIPLVGRHSYLEESRQRLRRGGTHLLYFEGEGGIGKTALLEALLARSQREGEERVRYTGCVADAVIDLYHVDVHTPEGLIRRIVQVLSPVAFGETQRVLGNLDWARSVGNADLVGERSLDLHTTFLEEFTALAKGGIVLAFDTLEVLEYERDPFQADLGERVPLLSAGEWLFNSFFAALQGNVLVLLAGRPDGARDRLYRLRERRPHLQVRCLRVGALEQTETIEYLKAVAHAESKRGDFDAAARLWDYTDERGEVIHLLSGGRPILLALVADLVAHGWTLPPVFGREVPDPSDAESDNWARALRASKEIESALVVRIQESPSPIGEVLQTLAWLRKGATPALLARVMGLVQANGEWDLGTAQEYLESAGQLTLVKVRSGDGRVFLHDELYALMEEYVLLASSQEERDRVFQAVLDYCDDVTGDLVRRIDRASVLLPLIQARLRHAYAEQMHYRLRYRPELGYATYFWLAEEALNGRDAEMDMLLRSEFLRTIRLVENSGVLDGLDPHLVELDIAVRWGMRALFFRSDAPGALGVFDRIETQWSSAAEELELGWLHLQLYQAAARIERAEEGDWARARELLRGVEQRIDALLDSSQVLPAPVVRNRMQGPVWWAGGPYEPVSGSALEDQHWLARTLQAQALSYEGYLDQQQGRYAAAMEHYQASAMLQRRLGMAGLARTLTNLSYTMALMGQFQNARLLAQEAERWARHSGKEYLLALALNTRAQVEGCDSHPRDALRYTEQALKIAEAMRAPRVRGLLYLTRARAQRYLLLGDEDGEPETAAVEDNSFDEALKEANQAVNLLKTHPPDRVAALIERGCLLREMARAHHRSHRRDQALRAAQGSRRDLERAAVLAEALRLPDQQVLAWTHLGWLAYHTGQVDGVAAILQQVYEVIPHDYVVPARGGLPPMARQGDGNEACLPFWTALGKAEMLRAFIALDRARQGGGAGASPTERLQGASLREAVGHIVLSLAYQEQIGDAHFDITRTEASLHGRILQDRLSVQLLHEYAEQAAGRYQLSQPTRFQKFLERMFGPADLWA